MGFDLPGFPRLGLSYPTGGGSVLKHPRTPGVPWLWASRGPLATRKGFLSTHPPDPVPPCLSLQAAPGTPSPDT